MRVDHVLARRTACTSMLSDVVCKGHGAMWLHFDFQHISRPMWLQLRSQNVMLSNVIPRPPALWLSKLQCRGGLVSGAACLFRKARAACDARALKLLVNNRFPFLVAESFGSCSRVWWGGIAIYHAEARIANAFGIQTFPILHEALIASAIIFQLP